MDLIPRAFRSSIFPAFNDPFEHFFDHLVDPPSLFRDVDFPKTSFGSRARVDWLETTDSHVFKADLPGLRKEEIKVRVIDDGVLSISGERGKEKVNEGDNYRCVERSYGKFSREFKLPGNSRPQDVSAKVENGVLTVTVPKAHESKKATPRVRDVQID